MLNEKQLNEAIKKFSIQDKIEITASDKKITSIQRNDNNYTIALASDFRKYPPNLQKYEILFHLALISNANVTKQPLLMQEFLDDLTPEFTPKMLRTLSTIFAVRAIWASDTIEDTYKNTHKDLIPMLQDLNNKARRSKKLPAMSDQEFFYFVVMFAKVHRYYEKYAPSYHQIVKAMPNEVGQQFEKAVKFLLQIPSFSHIQLLPSIGIKNFYKILVKNISHRAFNIVVNLEITEKNQWRFL